MLTSAEPKKINNEESSDQVIEFTGEPLSAERVEGLLKATHSDHTHGLPLTLCTIYRHPEFDWLRKLDIELKNVLHAEQSYEYYRELRAGERPYVRTIVRQQKKRAGLVFMVLESEFSVDGEKILLSRTTFYVRKPESDQ